MAKGYPKSKAKPSKGHVAQAKVAAKSKVALAALQPGKSIFDLLDEQGIQNTKRSKHDRTRSLEQTLAKQLRTNFNNLKLAQAMLLDNKHGKSLHQTLEDGQRLRDVDYRSAPTLGNKYYAQLREELQYSDAPLKKLSRCSWTTMAEEQGHVAASSLLKLHKQYGIQTLQCRAMVCQARPLFAENPIHKKIDAKSKQKEALTSKQTNRITGRHLFLRGLHREADRMLSDGRSMPSDMRNTIFMKHGGRWNNLHPEKKAKFDDQVEHARDEAEAAARDKVQKLDEEIEELRQQLAKDRPDERPLRMSDCRFSHEDLVEMEALGETAEFSAANVAIRRDEAARKLQPPHPSVGKALASIDISMPKEKSKVPDWVRLVALNRDHFVNSAFKIEQPNGDTYWKFCYAKQYPWSSAWWA